MFFEKKQIMIFAAAAAIFGGFVLFRCVPLSRQMRVVKSARAQQNMIIARGLSDGEQLSVFTGELNELHEKLDNYEANIPAQKDLGSFLQKIAELMDNHDLKDQVIRPLDEVRTSELICIPVSIEGTGGLTQIFEFYRNLQDLEREIRIKQVKLQNAADFSGQTKMQTQIAIYYRSQVG